MTCQGGSKGVAGLCAQEAMRRGCGPGCYVSEGRWARPTIMLLAAGNRCGSQVAGQSQAGRGRAGTSYCRAWMLWSRLSGSGKKEERKKERRRHGHGGCDRRNKSSRETREQQALMRWMGGQVGGWIRVWDGAKTNEACSCMLRHCI